jgi:hypothetical protein
MQLRFEPGLAAAGRCKKRPGPSFTVHNQSSENKEEWQSTKMLLVASQRLNWDDSKKSVTYPRN